MAQPNQDHQELMLSAMRKESIPVTVFLISGFQIRGVIVAFDNYVIIVDSDNKQQMVYKHAVSTIVPYRNPLNLPSPGAES